MSSEAVQSNLMTLRLFLLQFLTPVFLQLNQLKWRILNHFGINALIHLVTFQLGT
jgi:hypothetical protein